ncbi:hypothetical protein [Rhodococcus marinonascens]|uniref:hypothetical protein n=1 Tax=Rhodococcus marinonascens TaxID=38311 RepID=UPI0009353778|nr:hypothetical protein [Rhodococcus marinonascens]
MVSTDPRALIDDPNLSREYKVQLLRAWAAARQGDEASWQPYLDEYRLGERDQTPAADQRYTKLLRDGDDAQKANASRLELEERIRPDSLNEPDDMLDLGARGLELFELFLPAARKLGYESRLLTDYYARFDAERGMRLQSLGHDLDILGRSLDAGRSELSEHEKCLSTVRSGWSGIAATAAMETADRQNARAEAGLARLDGLAEVLFEANLTLSAAVTSKAFKVVSLHQSTVGGYSAAQIDVLADIYVNGKDGDNSRAKDCMEDASYWFPELADDDYRHINGLYKDGGSGNLRRLDRDDVVRRAAGIVKDWFASNFRWVYEEKQREFAAACEDCSEAVDAAYDSAIAEARTIEAQKGIRPEGIADQGPIVDCNGVPNAESAPAPHPGPIAAPPDPGCAGTTAAQAGQPGGGGGSAPASTAPAASPSVVPGPVAPTGPSLAPTPGGVPGWGGLPGLGAFPGVGAAPVSGDSADVRQGLAAGLGELGSIIRPLIDDAVSGLARTHDEDLRDELGDSREEEVHDGLAGAVREKNLELIIDGKSWTLSIDEDDRGIHLEMTDGQGGTSRFGVEIGPDGLPRIVEETGASEVPSEATPDVVPDSQDPGIGGDQGEGSTAESVLEASPAVCAPQQEEVLLPAPDEAPAGAPQPLIVTQHESAPDSSSEPQPLRESLPIPESELGTETGDSGAELAEAGPL